MTEAERHVCAFARAITVLRRAGDAHFDLVVAPYNSGAVMVRLAERAASRQGLSFWPVLRVPVYTPYRFANVSDGRAMPYDNAAILPEVRKTWASLRLPVRSLLFIDDEIGNGRAFAECLKLVAAARADAPREPCTCVIVAEADGFHDTYSFPGLDVRFSPYAVRPAPTMSGVIFDLVSDVLADVFRGVGDGRLDKKQVASILLDLPVKTLVNGVPQITHGLNRQAEKIVWNLARLRADFEAYIDELIAKSGALDL